MSRSLPLRSASFAVAALTLFACATSEDRTGSTAGDPEAGVEPAGQSAAVDTGAGGSESGEPRAEDADASTPATETPTGSPAAVPPAVPGTDVGGGANDEPSEPEPAATEDAPAAGGTGGMPSPSAEPTVPTPTPTGTAPVDPVPPQEAETCLIESDNPNASNYAQCTQEGELWRCSCATPERQTAMYLSGVTRENACETAIRVCVEGFSPDLDSEPVCSVGPATLTGQSCEKARLCGYSTDLGDGVEALELQVNRIVSCSDFGGAEPISCRAGAGNHCQDVMVLGLTLATACDPMYPLCTGEEPFPFVDQPTCDERVIVDEAETCHLRRECTQVADLGEGATAIVGTYHEVICQNDGGYWSCDTNDSGALASSTFISARVSIDVCSDALERSSRIGAGTPSPPTCALEYGTDGPDACSHDHGCSSVVQVDGIDVTVFGKLGVYCDRAVSNECTCISGANNARLRAAEGDDVCGDALARCLELIELDYGP